MLADNRKWRSLRDRELLLRQKPIALFVNQIIQNVSSHRNPIKGLISFFLLLIHIIPLYSDIRQTHNRLRALKFSRWRLPYRHNVARQGRLFLTKISARRYTSI